MFVIIFYLMNWLKCSSVVIVNMTVGFWATASESGRVWIHQLLCGWLSGSIVNELNLFSTVSSKREPCQLIHVSFSFCTTRQTLSVEAPSETNISDYLLLFVYFKELIIIKKNPVIWVMYSYLNTSFTGPLV